MPKLVISLPDAGEVIHELTEVSVTVGRTEENSLQIADPSVSTRHAEMALHGPNYILTDLGSTNGTRVNGDDLTAPKQLNPGDRIQFGKVEAIYEVAGKSEAHPLPQPQEAVPAMAATSSQRPEGFGNASPFQTKRVKKNPADMVAVGLFALAIVIAAAVTFIACGIEGPNF